VSNVKLVASRFLLPLEFYLGLMAMAWALSGGVGKGNLYDILRANGDSTMAWLLTLSSVGMAQCAVAVLEWTGGRNWRPHQLLRSAKARTAVSFVALLAWLWVIKMMMDTGAWEKVFVLILTAPATVAMQGWVCWENYRVRLAVDELVSTRTLQFRR